LSKRRKSSTQNMKKTFIILFVLSANFIFSQDYFEGKNLYCKSENPEAIRLFNIGIETLYLNRSLDKKYLKKTSDVFFKAYKTDTTFCDAMFFTGYTLRLLNDKGALTCYYMADSLGQNKSVEFKSNLAAEALRFESEAGIKLARKKYNEIIQYFPNNPEGYYGFAVTSPEIGDVEKGLENINIAIEKYKYLNKDIKDDVYFLKGVLLALNKKYEEGLGCLEKSSSSYKKDENYKIHYSLCLLKVSELKNDEKMKQKAQKFYDKIEHKEQIPKEIKDLLIF
jgi:tetratricopeptide (TPR) repeat protein